MTLPQIYKAFPEKQDCTNFLEMIRWPNGPICPKCSSDRKTSFKNSQRYKCNNCNMSYSVTVETTFHKTRVDLRHWFYLLYKVLEEGKIDTARELGEEIGVTKDTAWLMIKKIKSNIAMDSDLLNSIVSKLKTVKYE